MAKILDWQARLGSLRDTITGDFLTNFGSKFDKSSKGLSLTCQIDDYVSTNKQFNTTSPLNSSFFVYMKVNQNLGTYSLLQQYITGVNLRFVFYITGLSIIFFHQGGTSLTVSNILSRGEDCVIGFKITNDTLYIYKNAVVVGSIPYNDAPWLSTDFRISSDTASFPSQTQAAQVYRVVGYNEAIDQTEINKLQKEFLALDIAHYSEQNRNFQYPKSTSLREDGLVAAYNMKYESNKILTDISGNGNNGIINGQTPVFEYLRFKNNVINVGNGSISEIGGGDFRCAFRIKTRSVVNEEDLLYNNLITGGYLFMIFSGMVRFHLVTSAGMEVLDGNTTIIPNTTYTIEFVVESGVAKIYVNGFLDTSTPLVGEQTSLVADTYLGGRGASEIDICCVRVYEKAPTLAEVQDYHNLFAKQLQYRNFLKYAGADGITKNTYKIPDSAGGTGTFAVKELQTDDLNSGFKKGQKYIECVTDGTIAFVNNNAYGEMEFLANKASVSALGKFYFISSSSDLDDTSAYFMQIRGNITAPGRIQLFRKDGTVNVLLFSTKDDYIVEDVFYFFKIKRDSSGIISVFIKGGSFGSSYVLVDTAGGSGVNPVTDNTHTISNYIVADLDVGDKYVPGIQLKGILAE